MLLQDLTLGNVQELSLHGVIENDNFFMIPSVSEVVILVHFVWIYEIVDKFYNIYEFCEKILDS